MYYTSVKESNQSISFYQVIFALRPYHLNNSNECQAFTFYNVKNVLILFTGFTKKYLFIVCHLGAEISHEPTIKEVALTNNVNQKGYVWVRLLYLPDTSYLLTSDVDRYTQKFLL